MVTTYSEKSELVKKRSVGVCLRPALIIGTIAGLSVLAKIPVWAQDQAFAANNVANEIAALEQPEQRTEKRKVTGAFKKGLDAYLRGDFATAHAIWLPLAEQGDAVSAFNLGVLYARGQGTAADPARAVHWYRKAADAGYVLAQFNLGAAYMTGQGVAEDHNRAAQWWTIAAKQGHPQALFNLGTLYLHGDGVPLDRARALNLFQKASDLGDTRAYKKLQTLNDPTAPPPAALEADAFRPAAKSGPVKAASSTQVTPSEHSSRSAGSNTKVAAVAAVDPVSRSEQKQRMNIGAKRVTVAQNADPPATKNKGSAAPNPGHKSPPESEIRDSRFFAAADPQSWTIQVSAFKTRGQAEQFINRHGLRAEAILVEARVKGRTWYKVLQGVYENEAQARRGIDRLSKVLRKRSPWARRIGVVQEELVLQVPAKADADNTSTNKNPMSTQGAETKTEPRPSVRGWRSAAPAPRAGPNKEPKKPDPQRQAAEPLQEKKPSAKSTQVATRKSVPPAAGSQSELFQKGQSAFNNQDYKTTLEYWTPLATQGMDEAQYGLGFMYESGWGVKKDYIKAYQWYRKAAEQGHAQSQFNLGLLYQAGLGIPKNEALANYWIQSAADRDDPRAKEFLRNLRQESQR